MLYQIDFIKYYIENADTQIDTDELEQFEQFERWKTILSLKDDGFVIADATKQLGFTKEITKTSAFKFTALKIGCNVYGLCVDGYCMSR